LPQHSPPSSATLQAIQDTKDLSKQHTAAGMSCLDERTFTFTAATRWHAASKLPNNTACRVRGTNWLCPWHPTTVVLHRTLEY
jgi:hypothetical protein